MGSSELEESYLTVAEVAHLLKLNQQTVRNWIDQGSLPALRVGRRVRIKRSDLERVLADGYSPGAASEARSSSPSAADFWGGEPVGIAEPRPATEARTTDPRTTPSDARTPATNLRAAAGGDLPSAADADPAIADRDGSAPPEDGALADGSAPGHTARAPGVKHGN